MSDPLYAQECALREAVLLGPIGLDMASFRKMFPGVEEKFEHYVAVVQQPTGERVVGTALLIPNYPKPGVGKLMQMAVDAQRQGEGIGRTLVVTIESRAFGDLGLEELFCHARDTAQGFYSTLGWAVESEEFMEAGIPHVRMVLRPEWPEADEPPVTPD